MSLIHREGHLSVFFSALLLALAIAAGLLIRPSVAFWVVLPALLLFVMMLQFFRNPKRRIPALDNKLLYAPCDGKVVVIEEAFETEVLDNRVLQISIFMSPLNVHVNRVPVSGVVEYYRYHAGKYLVAWHPKSSTDNERSTIVIRTETGVAVLVRQIAGALARRIVSYVEPGMRVEQGAELGFIKFGSRVDLFIPLNSEVLVSNGQVVVGNLTPIARLK